MTDLRCLPLEGLEDLLGNDDPSVALRAVALVLTTSTRFERDNELAERVTALECPPEPTPDDSGVRAPSTGADADVHRASGLKAGSSTCVATIIGVTEGEGQCRDRGLGRLRGSRPLHRSADPASHGPNPGQIRSGSVTNLVAILADRTSRIGDFHFHRQSAPTRRPRPGTCLRVLRKSDEGGTCGIPCGKPAGPCPDLVGSRLVESRGLDSCSMRPRSECLGRGVWALPELWAWLNSLGGQSEAGGVRRPLGVVTASRGTQRPGPEGLAILPDQEQNPSHVEHGSTRQ